jgi:nicotinamidase/pyrazinamidase
MNEKSIRFESHRSALLLVDMQPDFMPGGTLAMDEGEQIISPVCSLLASGRFRHCAATQDWHPPGHVSFASSHQGKRPFETIDLYGHEQTLWPEHCVQGTEEAGLCEGIPW